MAGWVGRTLAKEGLKQACVCAVNRIKQNVSVHSSALLRSCYCTTLDLQL